MCTAIEFDAGECGQQGFLRVSSSDRNPKLLIRTFGGNVFVLWGDSKFFHFKKESLVSGRLLYLKPLPVEIIANRALVNGIWFQVKKGIRGILIRDTNGLKRVFIVTQASTHYFKIMTRSERMPILIDQTI